jgi:hypothetical protein
MTSRTDESSYFSPTTELKAKVHRNDREYSLYWDTRSEIKLLRDLGRKRFWTFFLDIFGAGVNPKGELWIDPAVHEPLADWFQEHIDSWMEARRTGRGYQKHLAILIPRGMGKTTMFTQAFDPAKPLSHRNIGIAAPH